MAAKLLRTRIVATTKGALGDDEQLDSVEALFNWCTHVPQQWRGGGMERMDDELDIDPQVMEDDVYAE